MKRKTYAQYDIAALKQQNGKIWKLSTGVILQWLNTKMVNTTQ